LFFYFSSFFYFILLNFCSLIHKKKNENPKRETHDDK